MTIDDQKKLVLITGANGFIGNSVVSYLANSPKYEVRVSVRKSTKIFSPLTKVFPNCDISTNTDWKIALEKVDCVIHCAARVHVLNETSTDPLTEFRRINVDGTLNLARQAGNAGVKRFIFISSLKVNGEFTELGKPFFADDIPKPMDPYGISKMEAEQGLRILAAQTGMEVVIIRPPLVYGPGVKANFLSLMRWLDRGLPLPLGSVHNKRSFTALENLVDLIVRCVAHPAAANQVFLVSDDEDLSTTDLLRRMGKAMGKAPLLFPFPVFFLNTAAKMIRKPGIAQRLLGSLQVSISKTKELINWRPPISVDEALKRTAKHYLGH